ncbi:hypothetical protein [Streptomyces silvensis]|uniref:Uncharacterized protein n=1 Tax=Streptomyces silvensis TaxID=1765722 RepID=A0A0W7X436_9ACTN|nr:hypothetical protein [Streptomyces silvensis]KUF17555.1 hypothetical protein AT728_09020 [Streptomyces silvensis]
MPAMDPTRRRLRLSDAHISVLGLLVEEGEVPGELGEARSELRAAGILEEDDKISAELYPLVSTLLEPHVIARVEMTGPRGVTNHGAVVGSDFVFTHEGWPGEEESEYAPVQPEMLVFALARMVDLHQNGTDGTDAADIGEEISATMGVLDALLDRMESEGPDDAAAMAGSVAAPVRLAEVLAQLNCMWRLTVVWPGGEGDADGLGVSALAVWDCGLEGYWVRELPAEPIREGQADESSELKVRRVTAKEIWERITDLLPDQEQLLVDGPTPAA